MKRILGKKIPLYLFLTATGLLSVIIYHLAADAIAAKKEMTEAILPAFQSNGMVTQVRLQDYQLIKPLLLTESASESEQLVELKRAINFEINELKINGTISDASVYIRRLNDGEWISINNGSAYSPGSMIKIAAMIAYLKMCESDPRLLTREYLFEGRPKGMPLQTFNDDPLIAGRKYTATDLLSKVIVNSDNDATRLINEALDISMFKKVFTDLGIPEPDVQDRNFTIDVTAVSKFLGVLYNATYLNKENSEYALSLLSQSSFSKGIVNGLPAGMKVAHKFGETGNKSEAQLHETAIVYVGDDPYLITIMTKGTNVLRLPDALTGISRIAFEKMKLAS